MNQKFFFAILIGLSALIALNTGALAAPRPIEISADTNYQQTVWSIVKVPRLYTASILPAHPAVAAFIEKLDYRVRYRCLADYYLSSVGYFNSDQERGVAMVYSIGNCQILK